MAGERRTAEQLKALHRRVVDELWNNGNLDVIDEYLRPDLHGGAQAAGMTGQDAKRIVQEFRDAFPDLHVTIDHQVVEGDELATFSTMRGTHRAEFRGIQPNGNSMQVSTACHATFADGEVAEQSVTFDEETLLRQLR